MSSLLLATFTRDVSRHGRRPVLLLKVLVPTSVTRPPAREALATRSKYMPSSELVGPAASLPAHMNSAGSNNHDSPCCSSLALLKAALLKVACWRRGKIAVGGTNAQRTGRAAPAPRHVVLGGPAAPGLDARELHLARAARFLLPGAQ